MASVLYSTIIMSIANLDYRRLGNISFTDSKEKGVLICHISITFATIAFQLYAAIISLSLSATYHALCLDKALCQFLPQQ